MKRGFSLVELSIVLVILGLLTGGILAGQSLIRASELRAVTTEAQRYITAMQAFRDKYFAIPGDFRDATRFWGRLNTDVDCITNSSAAVASPGACDGNGSGAPQGSQYEPQQIWRHLALAGLIEGSYTGIPPVPAQGWSCAIGTSCPRSKLGRAGWTPDNLGSYGGDSTYFRGSYGNSLEIGTQSATEFPATPVLKPEEAWNIDSKMDDGKPGTGKVYAITWSTCTNASAFTDTSTTYKLDSGNVACGLGFSNAF